MKAVVAAAIAGDSMPDRLAEASAGGRTACAGSQRLHDRGWRALCGLSEQADTFRTSVKASIELAAERWVITATCEDDPATFAMAERSVSTTP
jgi:hypothetical protein